MPKHLLLPTTRARARPLRDKMPRKTQDLPGTKDNLPNNPILLKDIPLKATRLKDILRRAIPHKAIPHKAIPRKAILLKATIPRNNTNNRLSNLNPVGSVEWGCPLLLGLVGG